MIAVIRESIFTYSRSTEEHALAVKDTQVGCGDDHSKNVIRQPSTERNESS